MSTDGTFLGGGEPRLRRIGRCAACLLVAMLALTSQQLSAAESSGASATVTITTSRNSPSGVGDPAAMDPESLDSGGLQSRNVVFEQLRRPPSDTNQPGDSRQRRRVRCFVSAVSRRGRAAFLRPCC